MLARPPACDSSRMQPKAIESGSAWPPCPSAALAEPQSHASSLQAKTPRGQARCRETRRGEVDQVPSGLPQFHSLALCAVAVSPPPSSARVG